ncbi:MAG: hypothetical protein M1828_006351 [Chrysothrix sp. TS-e1954]|nr:MAG: hypothetical protein M1828_006351 [Chrysothrix sp. TS-e1954]
MARMTPTESPPTEAVQQFLNESLGQLERRVARMEYRLACSSPVDAKDLDSRLAKLGKLGWSSASAKSSSTHLNTIKEHDDPTSSPGDWPKVAFKGWSRVSDVNYYSKAMQRAKQIRRNGPQESLVLARREAEAYHKSRAAQYASANKRAMDNQGLFGNTRAWVSRNLVTRERMISIISGMIISVLAVVAVILMSFAFDQVLNWLYPSRTPPALSSQDIQALAEMFDNPRDQRRVEMEATCPDCWKD